jgi:hypothetical protein
MLDMQVTSKNNDIILTVREIIEKLRRGELRMDDLSADTQSMVRKGALEMKNTKGAERLPVDGLSTNKQ